MTREALLALPSSKPHARIIARNKIRYIKVLHLLFQKQTATEFLTVDSSSTLGKAHNGIVACMYVLVNLHFPPVTKRGFGRTKQTPAAFIFEAVYL